MIEARPLSLPNGMIVEQIGGLVETRQIYREIFEDDVYVQEGIALREGDVVVDVGANIGMFALRVLSQVKAATVVSVEPVPPLFAALEKNVAALLAKDGAGRFRAVCCAAGDAPGEASFEFYPRATAFSTMFPDERARLEPWLLEDLLSHWGEFRARFPVMGALLYPFRRPLMKRVIKRRTSRGVPVHCEVRTLSRIFDDEQLARVDLLKIDVEGAELHALRGIEARHWPAIAQVALEVQDLDGRMRAVRALLEEHGFHVVVKPDDTAAPDAQVRMVYARRRSDRTR